MSPTSKGNALKLASTAHDLGGEALRGTLEQNESRHWTLSYVELESWLVALCRPGAGVGRGRHRADGRQGYTRTCRTCGREYEGASCPHCDEVRRRLRR